jgi:hypothetical protein
VDDSIATWSHGGGGLDGRLASSRSVDSSDKAGQGRRYERRDRRLGLQWMPVEETGVP